MIDKLMFWGCIGIMFPLLFIDNVLADVMAYIACLWAVFMTDEGWDTAEIIRAQAVKFRSKL